jgi:flavorubredoxin
MSFKEIKSEIWSVGAIDWDRVLFDELIPLPDGTSYNSYLIKGNEKTALIDTVDPTKTQDLVDNLQKLGLSVDFVIANHAEQDHSCSINAILELFPDSMVVTNPRCKDLLMEFHLIPEARFKTVEDGETLSLGDKTLEFIYTPWVHWPDTMVTYLQEKNIMFSCDFFGSHLATSELYVEDRCKVYSAAKRYYAEIMMPFRAIIKGNIEKILKHQINYIAPSHGPIHQDPELIINAYQEWVSDKTRNTVVIPYVSMHGSTRIMVDYLVDVLIEKGIKVKPFNLSRTDIGELAEALVDATTIIIASPTVLTGPHPLVVYATYLANALKPKLKFASIIGSYGWGGRMIEQITNMLPNLKIDLLEPVIIKGLPTDEDLKKLDRLAAEIERKHSEII